MSHPRCERPDGHVCQKPSGRTAEQVSVLGTARSCLLERHWEVAEAIEKAFPDAFEPEPEWAEDQVVMVKFRKHSGGGWKVARRDGGEWITRDDVNSLPADKLADRFEVRRLSPEFHAELLAIVRGEQA